jgi:hypothetical protein
VALSYKREASRSHPLSTDITTTPSRGPPDMRIKQGLIQLNAHHESTLI